MNIYFACSITGGRDFEAIYQAITSALLEDGHEVPTAHLADPGVTALEKQVEAVDVYTRDVAWIRACDTLVAEVSTPSHGVGYEVAFALSLGKPVLCVHQQGKAVSKMLTGNTHPLLTIKEYQQPLQAAQMVRQFLQELIL